jgi:hypothetical protein
MAQGNNSTNMQEQSQTYILLNSLCGSLFFVCVISKNYYNKSKYDTQKIKGVNYVYGCILQYPPKHQQDGIFTLTFNSSSPIQKMGFQGNEISHLVLLHINPAYTKKRTKQILICSKSLNLQCFCPNSELGLN